MKIRSSSYDCARRCEQLFYWKYILGLVPNKEKNVDTYFGSSLHESVRMLHTGEDYAQIWQEYDVNMSVKDKNAQVGRVLMRMYEKRPLNLIDTEKNFEVLIGKHRWVGRFDGIASINNALYVVDHKTTRWGTTGKFAMQLKPNNQFISYVLGGRIYYKDIDSIIINVFNVRDMKIEPLYVSFSCDEIDSWIEETKLFLSHLVRCINKGCFPKANDCRFFGYECAYRKLCLSGSPKAIADRAFHVNQEAIDMSW